MAVGTVTANQVVVLPCLLALIRPATQDLVTQVHLTLKQSIPILQVYIILHRVPTVVHILLQAKRVNLAERQP